MTVNELRAGIRINDWELLSYFGNHRWLCKCICGTEKYVNEYDLAKGASKSCGCSKHRDLVGKHVGDWYIHKYIGNKKYLCECSCGTIKEVYGNSLRAGQSKSCGGPAHTIKYNLKGKQFGEWEVLYYTKHNRWMCKCECGTIKEVGGFQLRNGTSKSCGHRQKLIELTGEIHGHLTVKEYSGNGRWKCECDCGNIVYVLGKLLRNNSAQSCGCAKSKKLQIIKNGSRTIDQMDIVKSKEKLEKMITDNPLGMTYLDIAKQLGVTYPHAVRVCNEYNITHLVKQRPAYMQAEILEIVQECIGNTDIQVLTNDRTLLKSIEGLDGLKHTYEVDIYIPDRKLAIEFNGNYWHSDIFKDSRYHQNKTIECAKKGVRLIHIFEYEWEDSEKRPVIENYLKDILRNKKRVAARNTKVVHLPKDLVNLFLIENHIQGSIGSKIDLGLVYKHTNINDLKISDIVSVMTFGTPRYNSGYQYEILRFCNLAGTTVIGGAQKLFKEFLTEYKPLNVITYSDITKFTGNIYTKLGFNVIKPNAITKPNYVWVNPLTKDVYKRYSTTKAKLVELGLGSDDETENEIMERLGFIKIYDSGNIRLEWCSTDLTMETENV